MVILSAICAMMAANDMLTLGYFPLASIVGQVGSIAPLIVRGALIRLQVM